MSKVFGKSCFTDLNITPQDSQAVNNGILQFLADCEFHLPESLVLIFIFLWMHVDGYERVAFNHEVDLVKKVQVNSYNGSLPGTCWYNGSLPGTWIPTWYMLVHGSLPGIWIPTWHMDPYLAHGSLPGTWIPTWYMLVHGFPHES